MYLSRLSVWRPEEVLSNADLSRMVDTSDDWIVSHVGIRERRRSPKEMKAHEQGALAVRQTLAGLDEPPDLLVAALSISDYQIPSTANLVGAEVGLSEVPAFDVRAACSSFVFALHMLRGMLTAGLHKRALLVLPETYTHATDYRDRNTCILWGDASFACLLTTDKPPGQSFEVLDTRIGSRSADWRAIEIPVGGTFTQRGPVVQAFAIRKMGAIVKEVGPVDWFVGHQANLRILTLACERAGLRPEQNLHNIERFGNVGAAGAPSVLHDEQARFKQDERIVVATVGAGLSWGTALLRAHR